MWRLPGNVSLKDAAVLISGHSTAVYAFSNLCKPKENDSILITAGPAGLGLAAVDVAANVYKMKVGMSFIDSLASSFKEILYFKNDAWEFSELLRRINLFNLW